MVENTDKSSLPRCSSCKRSKPSSEFGGKKTCNRCRPMKAAKIAKTRAKNVGRLWEDTDEDDLFLTDIYSKKRRRKRRAAEVHAEGLDGAASGRGEQPPPECPHRKACSRPSPEAPKVEVNTQRKNKQQRAACDALRLVNGMLVKQQNDLVQEQFHLKKAEGLSSTLALVSRPTIVDSPLILSNTIFPSHMCSRLQIDVDNVVVVHIHNNVVMSLNIVPFTGLSPSRLLSYNKTGSISRSGLK